MFSFVNSLHVLLPSLLRTTLTTLLNLTRVGSAVPDANETAPAVSQPDSTDALASMQTSQDQHDTQTSVAPSSFHHEDGEFAAPPASPIESSVPGQPDHDSVPQSMPHSSEEGVSQASIAPSDIISQPPASMETSSYAQSSIDLTGGEPDQFTDPSSQGTAASASGAAAAATSTTGPLQGGKDPMDDRVTLYIGNVSPTVTELALARIFGEFGTGT